MPTARLPFTHDIESRTASTAKDSRAVNAVFEGETIVKRPGLINLNVGISAGQGQGLFSWDGRIIAVTASNVYSIVNNSATLLSSPSGITSLPLSFAQSIGDSYLAFHDGSNIYSLASGAGEVLSPLSGTGVIAINLTNATTNGWYGETATVTSISLASPAVVTQTAHGLVTGQGVSFTTTGALDATMIAGETYQVIYIDANTYSLQTIGTVLEGGGVDINTTAAATGTITVTMSPTVILSGGGGAPQATATARVFGNRVSEVVVNTAGTYTSVPTVTIGTPIAGTTATVSLNLTVPRTYSIVTAGSRYNDSPTITSTSTISGDVVAYGIGYPSGSLGTITLVTVTSPTMYFIGGVTTVVEAPASTTATAVAAMNSTITGSWAAGLVFLDDAFYVMDKDTGKIYNSAATVDGGPTIWSGDYITAGSDADEMVAIARHLNYLVAFGRVGTEFFYDAANATGSPLDYNKSAYFGIGCVSGYSLAHAEQTLIWMGQSETEGRAIYMLSGLSPIKISTRYIDKYLNSLSNVSGIADENIRAYCMKISGHTLYVLTLKDIDKTLVYDLDEKKWYFWSSQSGDTDGTDGTETYFTPTFFNGNIEYGSGLYLQDESNGKIYNMSSNYYTDDDELIYFRSVSPILDSGSTKRKFFRRVEVVGDKVNGTLSIRKSDDDYATWGSYRTVDLSLTRPILYQNGTARRRAWEIFSSDEIPVRLQALEMDFDIGEMGMGQEG